MVQLRATQHFHRGLLLTMTQQKKRILEKHTEIFLEFLVFLKKANKRRKTKGEKNYLHGRTPNKQKKYTEIFLEFLVFLMEAN